MKTFFAVLAVCLVQFASYAAFAQCSGSSLSNVITGDKSLAIEVTTYPSREKKYAIDDDGLVALNIAASFCFDSIESPRLELTPERRTCLDDVQKAIVPDQQIGIYSFSEADRAKTIANDAIKSRCGFDMIAEWQKAKTVAETKPLSCAAGVKTLINKASARADEFFREQTSPKKLGELFENPDDRTLFTSQIREATTRAKNFARLMTTPPVNARAFNAAFEELKKANKQHTYAFVSSADETPTAETTKSVDYILGAMGSQLPYEVEPGTPRRRMGRTRCGAAGITQSTIDIIANSNWTARASAPSTATQPEQSSQGGAK